MVDTELLGVQAQIRIGTVGTASVDVVSDDRSTQDLAGVDPELVGSSRVGFQGDPREGIPVAIVFVA